MTCPWNPEFHAAFFEAREEVISERFDERTLDEFVVDLLRYCRSNFESSCEDAIGAVGGENPTCRCAHNRMPEFAREKSSYMMPRGRCLTRIREHDDYESSECACKP